MSKPKRVFGDAISGISLLIPDTGRLAIRALKILDGAEDDAILVDPFDESEIYTLDNISSAKLAELMAKARRDAEKQPKQVNK